MGDHRSKALLQKLVPSVDGTVLEIGSLDNGDGKATSLRDFYKGPYYGIDIQAGNNVDVVLDICKEDAWRKYFTSCPKLILTVIRNTVCYIRLTCGSMFYNVVRGRTNGVFFHIRMIR